MKKEKRELTLKQLEMRDKIAYGVFKVLAILFFSVAVITIIIVPTNLVNSDRVLLVVVSVEVFLTIFMIISLRISEIIRKCISSRKDQIKLKVLKQIAKEGNIKESVVIMDKEVITEILSRSIVKIVIDNIEGPNFVTSIQLSDSTWQSQVYISAEKLISILDEKSKNEMLDYLIKHIKIGNLDGETTQVTISSPGFLYTNAQTTDEELLEMFELKE